MIAFRSCFERGLSRNPLLEGAIRVKFVIERDGSVANVVDDGSDLPDLEVRRCVIQCLKRVPFPAFEGAEGGVAQVKYSFPRFEPR